MTLGESVSPPPARAAATPAPVYTSSSVPTYLTLGDAQAPRVRVESQANYIPEPDRLASEFERARVESTMRERVEQQRVASNFPRARVESTASGLSEAQRPSDRKTTAASSVFFCFGDENSDEEDEEAMGTESSAAQSSRRNTTGAGSGTESWNLGGRNRARVDTETSFGGTRSMSLPGNAHGMLSAKFTVNDVARRETLAAEALGVRKNARKHTVATAFRKEARNMHPDKGGMKEDFQVLREAYANLLQTR